MLDSKILEQLRTRLEEMVKLLNGKEWSQYLIFLRGRRGFLQDKVNRAVREGNLVEAQIAMALLEDGDKAIELFRKRLSETENQLQKGEI